MAKRQEGAVTPDDVRALLTFIESSVDGDTLYAPDWERMAIVCRDYLRLHADNGRLRAALEASRRAGVKLAAEVNRAVCGVDEGPLDRAGTARLHRRLTDATYAWSQEDKAALAEGDET